MVFASILALLYACVILCLTSISCFLFLELENVNVTLEQDPNSDSQVPAIQPGPNVRCKPAALPDSSMLGLAISKQDKKVFYRQFNYMLFKVPFWQWQYCG